MVIKKDKKDFTTKQMVVPAKYFLQTIAQDNEVAYPIEVIVLDQRGGGGSYMVDSSKELFRMCRWRSVFECGLVHVSRKGKRFYVELKEDGRIVIDKDILSQKRHMDTLEEKDVIELYNKYLSGKD